MKFLNTENGLLLYECDNFDPFVSCECGQCFRFTRIDENEYVLSAKGRRLDIKKADGGWLFLDIDESEFKEKFFDYFDLSRDYGKIIDAYSNDAELFDAAKSGSGIRIFRQDPWETLVSFIISQNNNIPRIKKIIDSLCVFYGKEENGFYSFPDAKTIKNVGVEGLAPIKSGFRAKYIIDAAEKVVSGEVSLERIAAIGYEQGLEELKRIKGVGDKVANCVLLFGFGYYEAFPVDVWVKRVIVKYYGNDFDPKNFGEFAGIAQQYLFYRERNILGNK